MLIMCFFFCMVNIRKVLFFRKCVGIFIENDFERVITKIDFNVNKYNFFSIILFNSIDISNIIISLTSNFHFRN